MEDIELGNNHFLVTTRYKMIHVICKGNGNISYIAGKEVFSPIPWLVDNWGVDEKRYGKVLKVCKYPDSGDIDKDAEVLWYEGEMINIKDGDKIYFSLSDISKKLGIQKEQLYIPEIPRISLLRPGYVLLVGKSGNDYVVFPQERQKGLAWICYDKPCSWDQFYDSHDKNFGLRKSSYGPVIKIFGPTLGGSLTNGNLLWHNTDPEKELFEITLYEIANEFGILKENLVIKETLEE